jgi:hypothetical protein
MMRNLTLLSAAAGLVAAAAINSAPAVAGTVTFEFGALSNGASNAQIQSFMNTALGANGSVVVKGAVASNSYTGDGHATGPVTGTRTKHYSSYTLAGMDPAGHGTFIMNDTAHSSNDILMTFSGLKISSISFDLEIFPDGSCTALSKKDCGGTGFPNQPDLTLLANGSEVEQWLGLTPHTSANSNGVSASAYADSPAMHSGETAPQLLGSSGLITLPANITTLDFQDWPATIAINNFTVNFTPPASVGPVPEPGTLALLGSALFGFGWVRRRRPR